MLVQCVDQLVGRALLILSTARRRREVELVLADDEADPGWHRGHKSGEPSKRHRLRVRLPLVASGGNLFERAARAGRFTIELGEKEFGLLHAFSMSRLRPNRRIVSPRPCLPAVDGGVHTAVGCSYRG